MRWHIVRTLLHKEVLRQLANRGGIALALLLIVAALLMTLFAKEGNQAGVLTTGVDLCFIDYWEEDGWVKHLRDHEPANLKLKFRHKDCFTVEGGQIVYPLGCGAIQMRTQTTEGGKVCAKIWPWDPTADGSGLAPYEVWFWRESARYFQQQTGLAQQKNDPLSLARLVTAASGKSGVPEIELERSHLKGGFDMRLSVTSALILFALFFSCVYLLPSMMCEERERGVLLAQALSPASPLEILAAKFLFYPFVGVALAVVLAGIAKPAVLTSVFFWLVIAVAAFGSLGIGLAIACIAKTQRTASMGALCYMMVVAMLLFICQQGGIPLLPDLALEYHVPRMLHAALGSTVEWFHWLHLAGAMALAIGWATLATILFRERGWQ
jgi:ABC-2 type transporter